MRPPAVPILTIFTFFGFVASIQLPHLARLADKALIIARQGSSTSPSRDATPTPTFSNTPSTTSTSSTTTSTSSTTSSIPTRTSSSRTTSFEQPTSTSETSISFSDTPTTTQSSSTTSRSTTTRASTSRSVALSDLTDTSLTLPTSFTSTFASASDGTSFTVTAVVSRPTNGTGATNHGVSASSKNGFFANKGAVAGTFLVVGLFGAAFLICAFLWVLRKYRRRRNDQTYFDDEYKEFNRDRNGTTPEPTLPVARDSSFVSPVPSSPAPNMIERLHGRNQDLQDMYHDRGQGQYQRESGDFDPYKVHNAAAYGHSDDQTNYTHPYGAYGQQEPGAYAYEPQVQHQAVAGPSHSQQQSLDSFYQTVPSPHEPQAR